MWKPQNITSFIINPSGQRAFHPGRGRKSEKSGVNPPGRLNRGNRDRIFHVEGASEWGGNGVYRRLLETASAAGGLTTHLNLKGGGGSTCAKRKRLVTDIKEISPKKKKTYGMEKDSRGFAWGYLVAKDLRESQRQQVDKRTFGKASCFKKDRFWCWGKRKDGRGRGGK